MKVLRMLTFWTGKGQPNPKPLIKHDNKTSWINIGELSVIMNGFDLLVHKGLMYCTVYIASHYGKPAGVWRLER